MTRPAAGRPTSWAPLCYLAAAALLGAAFIVSLGSGALHIAPEEVLRVLQTPDDSRESLAVWTLRFPRTLAAGLAGAALGVSGLLLQGVTRNPLADPGILGVEAGAALALMLGVVFFPALGGLSVPLAFGGGLLAAGLTLGFAARSGFTPLRLALSGVAVAALCSAVTRSIQILWEDRAQAALVLLNGSVAGRTWEDLARTWPWLAAPLVLALLLGSRVNLLALGEDVARSLGAQAGRDLLGLSLLGVLLAAGAVALTGPLGYVGLIVPHLARGLLGRDHRLTLPLSALLGAALLILADVAARLIDAPAETPVGLLIAALGTPFFIVLARRIRA
ncbi:FecCD family ABC transporter permease [Deinococcus sp. SL84]|uniref:FecCD family ABC transporter permease n=1 Tax=Deinococcus sp. SL84 TaxID=2994663 RepID=UPI002272A3CF|nr:iron ABC transporter permease [Deinococcus sp. SL84]MCY1703465.1 iron ABC transporter permease [Deinococcus sp. SL84]